MVTFLSVDVYDPISGTNQIAATSRVSKLLWSKTCDGANAIYIVLIFLGIFYEESPRLMFAPLQEAL